MQPLHHGHIEIIKDSFNYVDELIIGIGSAQVSHEIENPFTGGERILMIKKALVEYDINMNKIYIIPLQDIKRNSLWVYHIKNLTPPFNKVFSGNPLVKRLFKEGGFEVLSPKLFDREKFSGRKIREKIMNDDEWKNLVPNSVYNIINKIDGVNRLKSINLKELNEY
jgi:nicotinamide-nucleotide adenylyltransferase